MIRLWASRLLTLTTLPIFIMHVGLDARNLFAGIDVRCQLRYRQVDWVRGGYWKKWAHYRYMHTKLQAWGLPCDRVAFMDYDSVPLRSLDGVFDACKEHELCGVADSVTPMRPGLRVINAGMMVLRPNVSTLRRLVLAAEKEAEDGVTRMLTEQGFLNSHFPQWQVRKRNNQPNSLVLRELPVRGLSL